MASQLAKAAILNTVTGERIPVLYNPEEYRLEQGNNFAEVGIPGLAAPPLQYVRGKARTLSMELFFDSYERGDDVRALSGRIVTLLDKLPDTQAPPVLLFAMGAFTFRCVLLAADQRYTMFLQDGTPVRVIVSIRFQEYVRAEIDVQRGLFVGPPTLHNLVSGERLADLAAKYLGDSSRWREIAKQNGIDDPFKLVEGQQLVIPGGTR
jgi:nucleoid-associated protein YgaU